MAEPLNICVVDDDRDVAEGLAEILELAGHQVWTAFSGQDALRILNEASCDIAFVNATLPDLNMLESFMAIRKAKPGMTAVMMTGYTIEQLLRQTVRDGSVSVLQKPVSMDDIVNGLEGAKPKGIVLVADDDPQIGAKIGETLRLQDHRVGIAHTAGDALDMVFADECDALVLDLRLPIVVALEVYLDLEAQDRALPTIVIGSSPDKRSGSTDPLRDPAVTGVLVKPFDPARLLDSLEKVHKTANEPPVEEHAVRSEQPAVNRGRILVIDDDRDLAEGLGDILSDLGHTVEIAFTGSEALEIAERFDAQIALVDIKLGRTSGLELISSLKQLRPGIINVVITANAGKESVIASLRCGAFDFLNKPMHPQDLFVIIDRCFEQIRAQADQSNAPGENPPEFAANVSHELRDPLNAVIGFSEILGDEMLGPLGSEQYVHYARGINEAGHHLTTVIDDMIDQKPPTAETPKVDTPEGGAPQEEAPYATLGQDETVEHAPDGPSLAEPSEHGSESSEPQTSEPQPGELGPEQGEAVDLGDLPSSHLQDPDSLPEATGSIELHDEVPQARQTWLDQQDAAGLSTASDTVAGPDGTEDAELQATQTDPEQRGRGPTAYPPLNPTHEEPTPPLFTGAVWSPDQPIPPDPWQLKAEDAEDIRDLAEDPWPTDADSGLAEYRPAETEQPEPAWPEPGHSYPPGSEPSEFYAAESSLSVPAWSEPSRESLQPGDAPPVDYNRPEPASADPLVEGVSVGPPDAGAPQPEYAPAIEPEEDQEEIEDEDEVLVGQNPMPKDQIAVDQEQEDHEEKIVRLPPIRRVI